MNYEPLGSAKKRANGEQARARLNDLVTEDEAALRFAALYCDRLRYCHSHGAWFEWIGSIWKRNNVGIAFDWARQLARRLAAEEPDRIRYATSKTNFAAGVERFSRSAEPFRVEADYWDRDPFLSERQPGPSTLKPAFCGPRSPRTALRRAPR
jgi:putative DNA primase/helicase